MMMWGWNSLPNPEYAVGSLREILQHGRPNRRPNINISSRVATSQEWQALSTWVARFDHSPTYSNMAESELFAVVR